MQSNKDTGKASHQQPQHAPTSCGFSSASSTHSCPSTQCCHVWQNAHAGMQQSTVAVQPHHDCAS
jgi:hypothetical protein